MSNYKDLAPGTRLTRRASSAGSRDAPLVGVPADRSRGARLCGEPGRQRTLGRGSMLPRGVLFFNLCLIGSSTRSPTWERSLPCDVHQPRFGRQDQILSAKELPEVLSLWEQSRGGRGKTDDHPSLTRLLDRDGDSLLVAVRGGRIVGTLIAAWDGWRGNMYRLAIHPALRVVC